MKERGDECEGAVTVSISDCTDDVASHLASCHLSRERFSEAELILARAGYLDQHCEDTQSLKVCSKHRDILGKRWRPPRSCQYPGHTGLPRPVKDKRAVTFQHSKEIKEFFWFKWAHVCINIQL